MCTQQGLSLNNTGIARYQRPRSRILLGMLLGLCMTAPASWAEDPGVTAKTIRIGATIPLEGDFKIYGVSMKQGMDAALKNQKVQKRRIDFVAINDFYNPTEAVKAAKQLIDKGIFAMVNSFGSPTTKAVLPLLAEHHVPALGFYTGAGFTDPGDILNFRASYAKEVESVMTQAIAAGLKPTEMCIYAQNDAYGMAGVKGFRNALAQQPDVADIVAKVDEILAMEGENPERDNIGPVGVYTRDTVGARKGYRSLKKWEETSGNTCHLMVVMGVYDPAATFMGYAHYKGETWLFSIPSPAAGDNVRRLLEKFGITDKVVATQIVPSPKESSLPIVVEARQALGNNLNPTSLESYMVGKLFVTIMQAIDGPITRKNFLDAARSQPYDIGGVTVDFTDNNQGSEFVALEYLREGEFVSLSPLELSLLFK